MIIYQQKLKRKHLKYIFSTSEKEARKLCASNETTLIIVSGLFPRLLFYIRSLIPKNRATKNSRDVVLQQLLSLLKSGIAINQASLIIQKDYQNIRIQREFHQFSYLLESGCTLGDSASKSLLILPELFRNAIKEVENTDQMIELFERSYSAFSEMNKLKGRLMANIMVLLPVILGICTWFSLEVNLYGKEWLIAFEFVRGIDPPFLIAAFVKIFTFSPYDIFMYCLSIFIFLLILRLSMRLKSVKYYIDRLYFRIPIIRTIARTSIAYYFIATVSTYMRFGYDVYQAIKKAQPSLGNLYIKNQVGDLLNSLAGGANFENSFGTLDFLSPLERSSFLTVLKTGSVNEGMKSLRSMLAGNHKLLIRWVEFIVRVIGLMLIVLLAMWYVAVDFTLRVSF